MICEIEPITTRIFHRHFNSPNWTRRLICLVFIRFLECFGFCIIIFDQNIYTYIHHPLGSRKVFRKCRERDNDTIKNIELATEKDIWYTVHPAARIRYRRYTHSRKLQNSTRCKSFWRLHLWSSFCTIYQKYTYSYKPHMLDKIDNIWTSCNIQVVKGMERYIMYNIL